MPQKTNKPTSALRIRNAGMSELVSEMEETVHVIERLTQSRMTVAEPVQDRVRKIRDTLENVATTSRLSRRANPSHDQG